MTRIKNTLSNFKSLNHFIVAIYAILYFLDRISTLWETSSKQQNFSFTSVFEVSFQLPNFWTEVIISFGLICALWQMAHLLNHLEKKLDSKKQIISALHKIGVYLIYTGFTAQILLPTLEASIKAHSVTFDTNSNAVFLALLLLGGGFIQISRHIKHLQDQLDSFV
jgi:uncharacterized membrane protein